MKFMKMSDMVARVEGVCKPNLYSARVHSERTAHLCGPDETDMMWTIPCVELRPERLFVKTHVEGGQVWFGPD